MTSREGPAEADGVEDAPAEADGAAVLVASVRSRVHVGGRPLRTPGVGSKRTHPSSGNHSSGHACASLTRTTRSLPSGVPGRKPTAIRAGMPLSRAIMIIALENCTQ
nr:hypothetical protein [Phycicoccus sp. DTK01]